MGRVVRCWATGLPRRRGKILSRGQTEEELRDAGLEAGQGQSICIAGRGGHNARSARVELTTSDHAARTFSGQNQVVPRVNQQGAVDISEYFCGCAPAEHDLGYAGPLFAVGELELPVGLRPVQVQGIGGAVLDKSPSLGATGQAARAPY